jgi:pyruvate ferredoxin oxidoreductase delta subunit
MGNVALLGACLRVLLPDGLGLLEQAIASRMGTSAGANLLAAREGYERCTRQHTLSNDAPVDRAPAPSRRRSSRPRFTGSTTDCSRNPTGTWSLDRPVIAEVCTACGVCALFCPEGAISRSGGSMVVDYRYCKGCGICEVVCPVRNAIAMEEVPA